MMSWRSLYFCRIRWTLAGHRVVLLADDLGVEDARGGGERVDRRVDAHVHDLAREHGGGVEVGERGRRRRVGEVVGGHVDRLHRRDRAALGRGDALLQLAHLGRQVGLVADRRGHAAEQRRDLGARLGEAEDVVDEQQHVLLLDVAEVLRHGEAGQRHPQARPGRLGHLAVDQRRLRLGPVVGVDHAGLLHLEPQVVALAGALAHAGEHREAAVLHGDVVDQLLDDDGLADAGAAEQAGLAALRVGLQEVDDLDPGLEHLDPGGLVLERRRLAVDRPALLGLARSLLVDRAADDREHAPERLAPHRHRDRAAGVERLHPAHHAVGGFHRDAAHPVLAQVLRHLEHHLELAHLARVVHLDGVVDRRGGAPPGTPRPPPAR